MDWVCLKSDALAPRRLAGRVSRVWFLGGLERGTWTLCPTASFFSHVHKPVVLKACQNGSIEKPKTTLFYTSV